MATQERKIPAPEPSPETRPFWEAATAGRLLIGTCKACGKPHYYPRALCPFCGNDATEWVAASGRGAVYSYSVMRRNHSPRQMIPPRPGLRSLTTTTFAGSDPPWW